MGHFHFSLSLSLSQAPKEEVDSGDQRKFESKCSTCKTSAGVEFYKRNPFNFFLKSPSIFKRNPFKKIAFNFIWKILCKFFKNHKLETIFEKSHSSRVIMKIRGATPQLVQNLTP